MARGRGILTRLTDSSAQLLGRVRVIQHHDRTSNARRTKERFDIFVTITSHHTNAITMAKTCLQQCCSNYFTLFAQLTI